MTNENLDRKSKNRKIFYFLGLTIGGIIFLYQLGKTIYELSNETIELKFSFSFVLAFIVLLFIRFLQIINWKNLMTGIGHYLPFKEVLSNYSLVLLPRYIPGGVWGYISRGEWLYKNFQISYGSSNYISAVEIILVVVSSLQIFILYLYQSKNLPIILTIILFLLLIIIPYLIFKLRKIGPVDSKLSRSFRKVIDRQPIPFINYIFSWLINILIWVGYGIAIYYFAVSLNLFTDYQVINYTFIFSMAWLIGFIIFFIPSGIGIREQIMVYLITNTQMIASSYAALISILMRVSMLLGEMIFLVMGLLIVRNPSIKKDTTNTTNVLL